MPESYCIKIERKDIMQGVSPWAASVKEIFDRGELSAVYEHILTNYTVNVYHDHNTLYISVACPKGALVVIRAAYSPADQLILNSLNSIENGVELHLTATIGRYAVKIQFPEQGRNLIRYTTILRPAEDLLMPFWPRDIVVVHKKRSKGYPEGEVHINQEGTRSGLQYVVFDKPDSGALLYMQNLTALNNYCEATQTSLANTVKAHWPELGFALPPAKDKPLLAGHETTLSDAFLLFDENSPKTETALATQFLNMLGAVYLHLPKPATQYHAWPDILKMGLTDLQFSHGCWSHAGSEDYLNAYVCDYDTPPELMVQMAVLMPLHDYYKWSGEEMPAMKKIINGIGSFYDKKRKTMVRWLPAVADELDGKEEQLKPNVMDSWYLHHPLINLGRMALRGDKDCKKYFLDSLSFVIKVARHFKYNWPVFYNMDTLEVIKAETKDGMGGEKDVAGLYAYLMMYSWQITGDKKYLAEAEKAAKTLKGKGFALFYQANNTAFSANALLWLYLETNKQEYLDLSYICLANIFRNTQLWECNYGYAKSYPTFFSIFPLNDAPYTAAYEEQEVFLAMHTYLYYSAKKAILPSVQLLLTEFIRNIVHRAKYYYPPNLPKEMLSDEVKMGSVDPNLWIALEDIRDGWEKSGQVGQEVYGAGVAFGIVPRHYHRVPGANFMIYTDYPVLSESHGKKSFTFKLPGNERLSCRLTILKNDKEKLPDIKLKAGSKSLKSERLKDGNLEFTVAGDQQVKITWD